MKVKCWPGRVMGIIGLFCIFWAGAYAVMEIPTDPKMIPLVILWGVMFLGACIDIILVGREGTGGLIVLFAGATLFLFILLWVFLGWEGAWVVPAVAFSIPSMISGFQFYHCRRRRNKLSD